MVHLNFMFLIISTRLGSKFVNSVRGYYLDQNPKVFLSDCFIFCRNFHVFHLVRFINSANFDIKYILYCSLGGRVMLFFEYLMLIFSILFGVNDVVFNNSNENEPLYISICQMKYILQKCSMDRAIISFMTEVKLTLMYATIYLHKRTKRK